MPLTASHAGCVFTQGELVVSRHLRYTHLSRLCNTGDAYCQSGRVGYNAYYNQRASLLASVIRPSAAQQPCHESFNSQCSVQCRAQMYTTAQNSTAPQTMFCTGGCGSEDHCAVSSYRPIYYAWVQTIDSCVSETRTI